MSLTTKPNRDNVISKTALGNIRETALQEKQTFYILTFQLQDLTRKKKSHAKACMLDTCNQTILQKAVEKMKNHEIPIEKT